MITIPILQVYIKALTNMAPSVPEKRRKSLRIRIDRLPIVYVILQLENHWGRKLTSISKVLEFDGSTFLEGVFLSFLSELC